MRNLYNAGYRNLETLQFLSESIVTKYVIVSKLHKSHP